MTPPPTAYRLREADLATERERILALWRSGLAQDGKPEAKFEWYYLGHPEGRPRVYYLEVDGEPQPAGAASLARRRMRLGTRALEGGVLADFVVVDAHRSFFPAHFLQKALRTQALTGYPLVFGMPNPQSEAVVRRAGYKRVGETVRYARVLRTARYLQRHLPAWLSALAGPALDRLRHALLRLAPGPGGGLRAEWGHEVPAGVDALWDRCAAEGLLIGARDAAFLDWRFARCPLHRYAFLALRTSDGRLAAYAVLLPRSELVEVADFLVDPVLPGAGTRLWREVALRAFGTGTASASVEFCGPAEATLALRAAGWVERERRNVYAAFAPGAGDAPDQWYLTAADEDV